jgi:hypothetical protein
LVQRDGKQLILSNNHVLACSNAGKVGDAIVQPGIYDGGIVGPDTVASLVDFVPISFFGGTSCSVTNALAALFNQLANLLGRSSRVTPYAAAETINQVDAALAYPTVPVSAEIIDGVGIPNGVAAVGLGDEVHKCGRTTGHTRDAVQQISATVQISYGSGRVAVFGDQLIMGPMSAGGDSGSAVLDADNNVVGLLFAGSDAVTIVSPIELVLDALAIEVVT